MSRNSATAGVTLTLTADRASLARTDALTRIRPCLDDPDARVAAAAVEKLIWAGEGDDRCLAAARLRTMLDGDDLLVEACRVEVEVRVAIARRPPGGIEIAGGAERVLLEDNLVRGGLRRPIDGLQIVGGARRPLFLALKSAGSAG